MNWNKFNYDDKETTAPPKYEFVWIIETFYSSKATIGYFDGFTMRTVEGSDDCHVTHWAPIEYPAGPSNA